MQDTRIKLSELKRMLDPIEFMEATSNKIFMQGVYDDEGSYRRVKEAYDYLQGRLYDRQKELGNRSMDS